MKKLLTSVLLGSGLLLQAQNLLLDTAVVSASRFNSSLQQSNRNVIVLGGEEIRNAPVETVAELLDFATGIDARQRGNFGTQTDLSIRGGSFEQVLVLLNGVRLSDPQTGHHLMNLPVQKQDIERIEILLGGGSYIFGGSAFSGAVNIITKEEPSDKGQLELSGGSHRSYQASYRQQFYGEQHQSSISINHAASDGFKPNTDFKQSNLFAQSRIELRDQQLNFSGGYSWQGFGAQNFYSDNFPLQYEKTRTLFLNLGLQSGDRVKIDRQLYWRRHWDEFQLFREEGEDYYQYNNGRFFRGNDTVAEWYSGHNYHRSDVLGGRLEAQYEGSWGQTSLAGEYRYEGVVSNNLGEALSGSITIPASRGSYHLGQDRHNLSLALEQRKNWQKLQLSGALLLNYNSSYEAALYPAFTAGYNFTDYHKLYASFNRSFRLPSYTDLYYRLGGAVGSQDLRPENSLNYEAGYKVLRPNYYFNVSLFRREGRDIIDWIQRCDSCELRASNTSVVNFNGLDASLRLVKQGWLQALRLDFVELGFSHLFTDEDEKDYQSLYVFDYLQNKLTLRAQHELIHHLKFSYSLSFQDRHGSYRDAASGQSRAFDDVWLINARLRYQWKFASLYVSAQNLLDRPYYDRGNVELPGLWLWSGLKLTF